jgi:hypothetical protein
MSILMSLVFISTSATTVFAADEGQPVSIQESNIIGTSIIGNEQIVVSDVLNFDEEDNNSSEVIEENSYENEKQNKDAFPLDFEKTLKSVYVVENDTKRELSDTEVKELIQKIKQQ